MKKGQLYSQPNRMPTRKVAVGVGGAGGLAVILVWLLDLFGIKMPPEVAAELAVLFVWLASLAGGYFVRERWVPPEEARK